MKISNRKKILYASVILLIILLIMILASRYKIKEEFNNRRQAYEISDEITQTTYVINEINGNNMKVTVKIKNANGIEEVITPDNLKLFAHGKDAVGIDYDVVNGNNYIFKVKLNGKDNYNDYVLNANKDIKPNINVVGSSYPILTQNGVKVSTSVEIEYEEDADNKYYTIENDDLMEYTGPITLYKEGIVTAKTFIDGEITKADRKKVIANLAGDALDKAAYDGKLNTYLSYTQSSSDTKSFGFMLVSPEMIGKNFRVASKDGSKSGGVGGVIIYFYNNNTYLSSTTITVNDGSYRSVTVPANTTKMQFFIKANGGWSGGRPTSYLYNITV